MAELDVIYLSAIDPDLLEAFEQTCGDISLVEIHEGSILDLEVDAIVSPANSFGFMDGGIDLEYSESLGWHIQEQLQKKICKYHHSELLIGAAEIVPTDNNRIPWVIAAPTMRVPMILQDTVNPYLAARAVFLLRDHGLMREVELETEKVSDSVTSIAFPGLGTGTGRVDPVLCGRQIRRAIEEYVLGEPRFPGTWQEAQSMHQLMYGSSPRDLQFK